MGNGPDPVASVGARRPAETVCVGGGHRDGLFGRRCLRDLPGRPVAGPGPVMRIEVECGAGHGKSVWGAGQLIEVSTHMRTRVRAGDSSAFAELFDDYARAVYNHAFRLTADWSTAEDVMAATFMEAWRLRDKVDPEGGSLRPWLLGIATNTARNQYRRNRRYRAAAQAAAAAELSVPDHAEDVADRLDGRQRLAKALT